jgi:uncharacterized protein
MIRSITLGLNTRNVDFSILEKRAPIFFNTACRAFEDNSLSVRTKRIGLSSFNIKNLSDKADALQAINSISEICKKNDIRWFSVPFNMVGQNHDLTSTTALEVINKHDNSFINFLATDKKVMDIDAIKSAAVFIQQVSQLSGSGFDNFRYGVAFNTEPNGAFFPFVHNNGEDGFSLALELIPTIVDAIKSSDETGLVSLRSNIILAIVKVLSLVNKTCLEIEAQSGIKYCGIDASLAPHPESEESSIPFLMQLLGLPKFGQAGTAFLAGYLTDIIKTAVLNSGIRATGFNGVMYSILEDPGFADVSMDVNSLPLSQLLSLSSICGCGVDMLPVPGDISSKELTGIMLDVAAKASWLNKPLGARILPIPNKSTGDLTSFEHDFFVNTRIQNGIGKVDFNHDIGAGSESLFYYSLGSKL